MYFKFFKTDFGVQEEMKEGIWNEKEIEMESVWQEHEKDK